MGRRSVAIASSQRHAAVDQMRLASDVACPVAGEKDGERGNFLGGAETAHRLPIDK